MKTAQTVIRKDFPSISLFLLQMIAVWVFAWVLFYFLRQFGIEEYPYVELSRRPDRLLQLGIHAGIGVLTGIFYGSSELLFERPGFQKHSYGKMILIKTALYFIMAVVLMTTAVIATQYFRFGKPDWKKAGEWLIGANFLVALTHFITVSMLISFIRQMNYKFGPGVLWNLLVGRYRQPREEQRIFMFLDLRSSTAIAEKLGHVRFTRLIQDCFFDLTEVVLRHKVDIYQYVGDEAILSWELERGLSDNHCMHCYFDFLEVLEKRSAYYEKHYGVQPFFKAGVHLGKVMVAEVGVIKKDIAYLGDVLNTAARIQGRCNELEQGLLISGELKEKLPADRQIHFKHMGVEILKGKQERLAIFGIEKHSE